MRPSVSDSSSVSCAVLLWDTEPGSELPIAFKGEEGATGRGTRITGPTWEFVDSRRWYERLLSWSKLVFHHNCDCHQSML